MIKFDLHKAYILSKSDRRFAIQYDEGKCVHISKDRILLIEESSFTFFLIFYSCYVNKDSYERL